MIIQLVPYAVLILACMAIFTSDQNVLSLLRWVGGLFVVAGVLFAVAGV